MFETIVEGTRRVLEFTKDRGTPRLLLTSSGAVYGPQPPELTHIAEDYPGAPDPTTARSAYGEGKRAAETLCALYASAALHPTIARCFAFVGPHLPLNAHFAAGNFIADALAGSTVHVQGDGTPYRSYMYASDLAVWLWTILLRGKALRPYNVGGESPVSVADLAHLVARSRQPAASVQIAQPPQPGASAHRYVPSTARARNELGLRETVDLERAIARSLAWYRHGPGATV
jgi:dTDP-glucose 4,6-dehydratase